MTMYIGKDDVIKFTEDSLTAIRNASIPIAQEMCPHCGCQIRFPIIARQSDIEMFHELLNFSQAVLDRHGVTAMLLQEIQAEIMFNIALKKSGGDHDKR